MTLDAAGIDVLVVVEDPGAANFIVELPAALTKAGLSCLVLACGHACAFLRDRGVAFREVADLGSGNTLDEQNPRLLLAGTSQNPDSHVLAMICEARQRGIATAGFVDMAVDAPLRFCGRTEKALAYAPEYLIVPDHVTQAAFGEIGFPLDKVTVCGHPAYDRVRMFARHQQGKEFSRFRSDVLGEDPAPRLVWLFVAEHTDGCEYERMHRSDGYTLHGRGMSNRRTDIVLEEVLDAAAEMLPRPFIILRLHPKNTRDEFSHYLSEVDMVSAGGDPLGLVWASDLVIGLSSMLLMEAAQMGRPTISVVPRAEECSWSPSVAQNLTPCVSDRKSLRDMLITPPAKRLSFPSPTVGPQNALQAFCRLIKELLHK